MLSLVTIRVEVAWAEPVTSREVSSGGSPVKSTHQYDSILGEKALRVRDSGGSALMVLLLMLIISGWKSLVALT